MVDGAALLEQALLDISHEDDDLKAVCPVEWDARLAEISPVSKVRIPSIVEERCRGAWHRTNCGLFSAIHHAWASADALLHLWDYRYENSEVLVVPADAIIVSVALCPPRPGIFDACVHQLLVVCTRLTVSLVGVQLLGRGAAANSLVTTTAGSSQSCLALATAPTPWAPSAGQVQGSIRRIVLEGYVARTDGALFHCVRHTMDGHILLICGAPQVYELACSRTPGWFHSKCRLIRHATGLWSRVRDFFTISAAGSGPGRIRLLATAPHNYAIVVDDASTVRLIGIRDQLVHASEKVAVLEELAAIRIGELSHQMHALSKRHLASRVITQIFLASGPDGHVRAHIVTSAGERLLCVCSAATFSGPKNPQTPPPAGGVGGGDCGNGAASLPDKRYYGFWLQQVSEARLGHAAAHAGVGSAGWVIPSVPSEPSRRRQSCLEETTEPSLYSSGVWVAAAAPLPDGQLNRQSQVGVTARVEDFLTGGTGTARVLHTSLTFDSEVFDIAEESDSSVLGGAAGTPRDEQDDLEPSAFCRANRTFALLLQSSVQVFRLSMKPQALVRPPATAGECFLYLAHLASPPSAAQTPAAGWTWTFDDAGLPSFEIDRPSPPFHLGRWLTGFLRFLAVALRHVWGRTLIADSRGRNAVEGQEPALCLRLREDTTRCLLARLGPVLRFARQGLTAATASECSAAAPGAAPSNLSNAAERSQTYVQNRTAASENLMQATRVLREVIEVASRAQEILGLISVLHAHHNAYRVLQSGVLSKATLEELINKPLGSLSMTNEAVSPAVQLCTALVVESGLTTPAPELVFGGNDLANRVSGSGRARSHDEICHELDEHCPSIFRRVDLNYVRSRLGPAGGAPGTSSSSELLRRVVHCVSMNSPEGQWENLCRCVKAMTAEDPQGALEICIEKLEQLARQSQVSSGAIKVGNSAAAARAKMLLHGFLDIICVGPPQSSSVKGRADPVVNLGRLLEQLLVRTRSLTFLGDEAAPGIRCFLHTVILDHLLSSQQLHKAFQLLLDSASHAADLESFLQHKFTIGNTKSAGELLWKHLLRQGHAAPAGEVLHRLAQWPADGSDLEERVHYLDQARQALAKGLPQSKEAFDNLGAQLDIAVKVQAPLRHELLLLALDDCVGIRWRAAADQRCMQLRQLLDLQTLYQTAVEFGMFNVCLVIADLSSSDHALESLARTWVSVFFPPAASPYFSGDVALEPAVRPHMLFPLLMVRRCETFFPTSAGLASHRTASALRSEDFRMRAGRLLSELLARTRVPSALWNVRLVATLLEYCNCLWLHAFEATGAATGVEAAPERVPESEQAGAKAPTAGIGARDCAWVAVSVLPGRPFHLASFTARLQFYGETLVTMSAWLPDLQALLPADPARCRPVLGEGDLHTYFAEVVVALLDHWLIDAGRSNGGNAGLDGDLGAAELPRPEQLDTTSWQAAENVLSLLRARLSGAEGALRPRAERMLREVQRIEAAGVRACRGADDARRRQQAADDAAPETASALLRRSGGASECDEGRHTSRCADEA